MNSFDLAIIGAGPGGVDAALRADALGLATALIEKSEIGGTCLNTGCIPTKALLASTRLLTQMRRGADYGLQVRQVNLRYGDLLKRKDEIVSRMRSAALRQLKKSKVAWIEGEGRFVGKSEIAVEGKERRRVHAKSILIATGSEPADLPDLKFDGKTILSSSDVLGLKKLPESLLIVGAGAVGAEFTSFFQAVGVEVTLVEMMPRLLPGEDPDCAKRLENLFTRRGIRVLTDTKIQGCSKGGEGFRVKLTEGPDLEVEKILLAVGHRRNTEGLDLERAGLSVDPKGAIEVNEYLETHTPGIFAIGDVISSAQLAHVASYEGILVVENLRAKKRTAVDYRAIPNCVYSDPEVVSVGSLAKEGEDPDSLEVRVPFAAVGKAQVESETEGFFKLRASRRNGKILGAAAIGAHVTELIPEIVLAVRLGLTVDDLSDTVHAHPTEAEVIALAARELAGRLRA